MGVLVQSRHLRAVVHVLDKVLPVFYPCQYYLLKNEQFLSNLLLFLHLDSGVPQGVTQQVTHRVAHHLTGAIHGDNVKLLNSMIQVRVITNLSRYFSSSQNWWSWPLWCGCSSVSVQGTHGSAQHFEHAFTVGGRAGGGCWPFPPPELLLPRHTYV